MDYKNAISVELIDLTGHKRRISCSPTYNMVEVDVYNKRTDRYQLRKYK